LLVRAGWRSKARRVLAPAPFYSIVDPDSDIQRPSKYAEIFETARASPFLIIGGDPMPEPEPPPLAGRLKVFKAVKAKLAEFRRRPDPLNGVSSP
jgi:hypothetical protein